ncbi:MAG: SusC/RagA family TonB-linked outer membrane protein [Thalassobius sp.]|nr:SusC/RagA family TonB-linked outer membrane protein [Thalassovita sp.]
MKNGLLHLLIACLSMLCLSQQAFSQDDVITGTIISAEDGEPVIGASIQIKGTTSGTITDIDGQFKLSKVPSNGVLIVSYIGFETQEVEVAGRNVIDITLSADVQQLEEIVVIGYGQQKKSVVTGAITSIKAADLETLPINNVGQALQGRTSGITIASNNGQPGSGATIRVRGITSFGGSGNDPLWVVDGVVVDNGGIGYLNQSDIESIEVLKDAASQAIYGARAAAGVVLVTTKKGKSGKLNINYSGYYGTSSPARRLNLANATEYATLRNESSIAAGGGVIYSDPQALGEGTDWQDQIFNNDARRQNHELSISGGNDVSTFHMSFGYLDQDGIVATDISQYKRTNVRLNSTHKLTKWLTVGENVGYAHNKSIGLGNTNNEFGGPLSSAINLDPITPAIVTDANLANSDEYLNNPVVRDAYGRPYGISRYVGQEITNPLAYIQTREGNYSWGDNIIGNVFAELKPIEGLTFRTTLGGKIAFWGDESFTPIYYLNSSTRNQKTSYSRSFNRRYDYNLENTVSYSRVFGEHDLTVLVGQGAYRDNNTYNLSLQVFDIPVDNFDDASLNYKVPPTSENADGYENPAHTVSSLFSRVTYNFKEKYLLTALIRRDGSSRFGNNNKYGVFPSASLGWVTSAEEFWPQNNIVTFLKVRGGYGVVGNDNIGDFAYLSTISPGRNYTIGNSGDYTIGYSPDAPSNPDLKWEETSQTNIGFEATIFDNVDVTFDWYKKVTTGLLMNPRIPGYIGAISNPAANVGDMENTGLELEVSYRKSIGKLDLTVSGNVSHLSNKVTYLGEGIEYREDDQQTFQASTYPITRVAVGHALHSFYGFKTQGIFQNEAAVQNHVNSEGKVIQPNAAPGDFIWADLNDDGEITQEDRTFIGSPIPDWTYGLTIKANYKNFDLTIFGQGVAGNEIFQGLRRLDIANSNYQADALGRWTGEGTTNEFPRLIDGDPNHNFSNPSDFYLQKGDYFRLKNIQLGYTLPSTLVSKIGLQKTRVYVMSENLFTFTNYTGYDPEIGGNVMSIDRGIYPQARSFMVGLNFSL